MKHGDCTYAVAPDCVTEGRSAVGVNTQVEMSVVVLNNPQRWNDTADVQSNGRAAISKHRSDLCSDLCTDSALQ